MSEPNESMCDPNGEESGKFPVVPDRGGSVPQVIAKTSHEIIDAAAALLMGMDFLANATGTAHREVVVDARASIARIVRLARSLRLVAKASPGDAERVRNAAVRSVAKKGPLGA